MMSAGNPSPIVPTSRWQRALRGYPADAVLFAMLLVLLIVILGSFAVDAVWAAQWQALDRPVAANFRGTCYWMADSRIYTRIAGSGYSDYDVSLTYRHLTILPDRSWWPVFVNLQALVLHLTGGYYCSGWLVNLIAMTLLPPVIHGITGSRRPLLLAGVALLPFGVWLYAGLAEGTFLLVSGVLLWICLRKPSARWGVNAAWGLFALAWGVLVGLTKPNALALLPAFGVLALTRGWTHVRAGDDPPRLFSRTGLIRLLDDANPAWTVLLGTLGIGVGLGLWFYQTSGYYPLYVLMAQRTLWYKEFDSGNPLAFFSYITLGWRTVLGGAGLPDPSPWNMLEFAVLTLVALLIVRDLPPRYTSNLPARRTPLYASIGMLTVFGLMFTSGQAHSIERYYSANIFFVVAFLRYVFGDEDEPPWTALPGVIRQREPGALRAGLRLAVLACTPALIVLETVVMVLYGI
jgi:hypothetical protein